MKKFFYLTSLMLLVATVAVAGVEDRLFVQPNATFATGSPATTNNDDSCDIGVYPAATLLLPNFEVEVNEPRTTALDTNFTIVNTSPFPQIAHITVWTDWSFPVLDFNIFLTGYDVQGLSMYDLIVRGQIPPTSSDVDEGARSADNVTGNPNPSFDAGSCVALPGPIPEDLRAAVQSALTTGSYSFQGCTQPVGANHAGLATGYVTIDVSSTCSQTLPTTPSYYTGEILFDNVLTGDWIRINPDAATGNFAGGNPLVHIRAIPEGGDAGSTTPTNLPFTFYDRYVPTPRLDRRQPLPGTFAARYIAAGAQVFDTEFLIWREGTVLGQPVCTSSTSPSRAALNGAIAFGEFVRFDESENPTVRGGGVPISPAPPGASLPEVSSPSIGNAVFPPPATGTTDLGGWVYMNLNNGGSYPNRASHPGRSQNWVNVSMSAEGRYNVLFDATSLGNGCSIAPGTTTVAVGPGSIQPAPNATP